MYTIVFTETAPYAVRGMPFHTGPYRTLVSISPELVAQNCPKDADKAINWAAMNHKLTLVSRTRTHQGEITLTLKEV